MAHKEWEPDELLDDLLDFNYKHPVPEHGEKKSDGLPADIVRKSETSTSKYGLSDEYKLYSDLRHSGTGDAGHQAAKAAGQKDLRSSGAASKETVKAQPKEAPKEVEIMEPLSARRKASAPQPESAAFAQTQPKQTVTPQPAEAPEEIEEKEGALSGLFSKFKAKGKQINASGLATEAIGAAKKLVHSDEDDTPEEIPAYENPFGKAPVAAAAEPKDDIAELFAELGETEAKPLSSDDNEALKQAQQDAYDRYRGNYNKKLKKSALAGNVGAFPKWLSRIYVVALAVFAAIIVVMNVLPFGLLIAFFIVLGLLSVIILMQLRRQKVGKWVRRLASVTAILLIACFGVGSAYALGTLSFLDTTSVKNENKVARITRDPFNVCITGMDVDGKIDKQGRSDVNMIVTVNPKTEQILMTSIPRDYEIYMPDKDNAMDKLTHTGFYSVETTIGAEENLLDTKVNYYVKVNFSTVKKFIDAVGGVDVYSEYEFTPVKKKDWTVQKGWNHMNGKEALAFTRERKAFADGDNQRIKNQQAVLEAVIKKATSSKTMVLSYNKILTELRDYFRMSFSSGELRSLIKMQLAKDPDWKIYRNTIRGGDGSLPTYTTGGAYAYVMTQDQESIDYAKTLINAVLEGKTLAKNDDDEVYVVETEESGETEGE